MRIYNAIVKWNSLNNEANISVLSVLRLNRERTAFLWNKYAGEQAAHADDGKHGRLHRRTFCEYVGGL